ncbi:hypothetical protein AgCh_027604 [Apium graveolens]
MLQNALGSSWEHKEKDPRVLQLTTNLQLGRRKKRNTRQSIRLDLKREECAGLLPAGMIFSEPFHLGGQGFFLSANCNMDRRNQQRLGLYLGMLEKGYASFAVYYEISFWSKEEGNYKAKQKKSSYTFTCGKSKGFSNLFDTTWAAFIADDSPPLLHQWHIAP